ncbi:MAG: DUF4845 domain-containing protein [Deltaproteobacteria bacterium]|nr:DUF4845 domain-containing protein [Deltaproteobacteria bacterium]
MQKIKASTAKVKLSSNGGIGRLSILLIILLVVSSVYVGNQVIPFYYYYHEISGLMENQAAKASIFSDEQIRKTLMKQIKKLELPIGEEEDLKINRFDGKILIELEYEEVLYLDLGEDRVYDLYVFKFNPRVQRSY